MRRIVLIIFLFIILLPLWMFLIWFLTPKKNIDILILDKTVLNSDKQEHASFFWFLKNSKFVKNDDRFYDKDEDYMGFFPLKDFEYKIKDFNDYTDYQLDSLANKYDMVYYTDLYGIYKDEWFEENKKRFPLVYNKNEKVHTLERSEKIYGGMTNKEVEFLKKMKSRNKLIIAEFNTFASPTPKDVRNEFQKTFDIYWTGWIGRYFDSLDTTKNKEIPSWLKKNYLKQNNNVWNFKKSGIAFVRYDDKIVILEDDTHLNTSVPLIYTSPKYQKKYNLPSTMKYSYWFDIIEIKGINYAISEYEVNANSLGEKILIDNNIPYRFPAVITQNSNDYTFFYFAGDFCDNKIPMSSAQFKYINLFSGLFVKKDILERDSFFWKFYLPLVKKIVFDYYQQIN